MKLYTIHSRQEDLGSLTGLANDVVLVNDGFSWSALFLPTVWFLAKKMWIVFAIYLALQAIVLSAVYYFSWPMALFSTIKFAGNIILGFEGNELYRWSLERQRYHEQGTIAARDLVSAEHRFFSYITSGRAHNRRAGEANYGNAE